jgi:pimeloyl-ACP methyl ester carboxylesterase
LDQLAAVFDGAVMMDCGQNVGPGASLKARIGLMVLAYIGRKWSNAKLMGLMVGETKKSKADYYLVESCFGAGMFFEQAGGQVECLKAVAPADYIPKYTFPVLYMNGSEDYRDSEDKWLELCTQKETSELKVYDGGDHFFMFDSRFVDDVLTRMGALVKTIS